MSIPDPYKNQYSQGGYGAAAGGYGAATGGYGAATGGYGAASGGLTGAGSAPFDFNNPYG